MHITALLKYRVVYVTYQLWKPTFFRLPLPVIQFSGLYDNVSPKFIVSKRKDSCFGWFGRYMTKSLTWRSHASQSQLSQSLIISSPARFLTLAWLSKTKYSSQLHAAATALSHDAPSFLPLSSASSCSLLSSLSHTRTHIKRSSAFLTSWFNQYISLLLIFSGAVIFTDLTRLKLFAWF